MKQPTKILKVLCLVFFSGICVFLLSGYSEGEVVKSQDDIKKLLYGFEHLQDSTRTKTWWFHGETETTKEGITADLEAFKSAGIGGVVYYDQVHYKADKALEGFSPEWWKMLRFASAEAARIGLTFELNISNGFVAGGKWITPEYGMQRLVATDTVVKGNQFFVGKIQKPSSSYNYSNDVVVLAFPIPKGTGKSTRNTSMKVSSNIDQPFTELFNISPKLTRIPVQEKGKSVYINIDFGHSFLARSISYEVRPKGKATTSATNVPGKPADTFVGTGYRILPDLGQLEVSSDGINYKTVCSLKPVYLAHESWRQKTISFAQVQGRYFRLNLHDWSEDADNDPDMLLGNVVISSDAKIDQWEEKAALYSEYVEKDCTPSYTSGEVIHSSSIRNITDKMGEDGVLRWQVPSGDWRIMRFAHVPTGGRSKHGRKNLLGLECDKLSVKAAEKHWNSYTKVILDSLRATHSGVVDGIIMDSHEAGSQNWTADFIPEFTQRRGYDPTLLLPALCGYVIDDVEETQGFLQDIRRNIADLVADNYYGTFERLCRKEGVTFTAQATGNALCIVADPILAKSKVTKPQGEFWPIHPDGNYDIKESSSAAHLYGKQIASAEAYTDAKFSHSLSDLKSLADYAYAFGINEFVVCASSYQPWIDKIPGSTGGGRHYCVNRNNTWWKYSNEFWDYQSRLAYVFRQGKPKSDLCIYLGENAPVKILTYRLPDLPGGFDFDAFTSDALINRMDAQNNKIVLPDGISYQMMILPRNGELTMRALVQIAKLVNKGAKVYGRRAVFSGSHIKENQKDFDALVKQLWGEDQACMSGSKSYGKGTVYWGMPLSEAIEQAGIQPDVAMQVGDTKSSMIYFTHRQLSDGEVYFLHNHKKQKESTEFTFRTMKQSAELWNPQTGKRYRLPIQSKRMGRMSIKLEFSPMDSYLIVLSDREENKSLPFAPWMASENKTELTGTWTVSFDKRMGGPIEPILFETLSDWTSHKDDRIKYYSGTASYRNAFIVDKIKPNERFFIQLDSPVFAADISVNEKRGGTIWCSPWKCDVTDLIKSGRNQLVIQVANSLMNRMIGDSTLPQAKRVTYCYPEIITEQDTLISSGLIGKIYLVKSEQQSSK